MKGKIQFIDIPTEQTTALTDAILAVVAIVAGACLLRVNHPESWKITLWAWAFGLLALAAILGTISHGFKLTPNIQTLLWRPLFLALGLLVALLMVGAVYDVWGLAAAQQMLPVMLIIGILFFCTTLIWPDTFVGFIIYGAVAMSFVLASYTWLALTGGLDGAWFIAAGILVTIIAIGVQAGESVSFTLIWQFDHNGVYHLIQMVGVLLLVAGLRAV